MFTVGMRNGANILCWSNFEGWATSYLDNAVKFDTKEEAEAFIKRVNPLPSGRTAYYFVVPLME